MSGKSDLWNHFIKIDLGGKCKYCHQEVKTKGNTTNLRNHLLRRHPTIQTVSLKKKRVKMVVVNVIMHEMVMEIKKLVEPVPVFLKSHSLFSNVLSLNKI